jgi:hypothetical protein
MSVVDFLNSLIGKGVNLTPERIRQEEIRASVREDKLLKKIEKLDKEKEEIFHKGARTSSRALRMQLARQFQNKSGQIKMYEVELMILNKEITTLVALRIALERARAKKRNISKLLSRLNLAEIDKMLTDERISTELYLEKLENVLSTVTEEARDIVSDLDKEGKEIMQIWEKLDEGEIPSPEEGLKQADQVIKRRIKEEE